MNTNITSRSVLLVGLLLVSAVAGVAASGAVAAQNATNGTSNNTTSMMANATGNATITADPNSAGAVSNHTVEIRIDNESAGNLTGVNINYSGSNASTVLSAATSGGSYTNIPTFNLSGKSIKQNITSVVSVNGETMNISLELNQSLETGDNLTIAYKQVDNPPQAGNYSVEVQLNPTEDPTNMTAPLNISEAAMTTTPGAEANNTTEMANGTTTGIANGTTTATGMNESTTGMTNGTTTETGMNETTAGMANGTTTGMGQTETTTGEETTQAATTTASGGGATTTSSGNGPGFGALVALVGVLAAALLAVRRN